MLLLVSLGALVLYAVAAVLGGAALVKRMQPRQHEPRALVLVRAYTRPVEEDRLPDSA